MHSIYYYWYQYQYSIALLRLQIMTQPVFDVVDICLLSSFCYVEIKWWRMLGWSKQKSQARPWTTSIHLILQKRKWLVLNYPIRIAIFITDIFSFWFWNNTNNDYNGYGKNNRYHSHIQTIKEGFEFQSDAIALQWRKSTHRGTIMRTSINAFRYHFETHIHLKYFFLSMHVETNSMNTAQLFTKHFFLINLCWTSDLFDVYYENIQTHVKIRKPLKRSLSPKICIRDRKPNFA